MFSPNSKMLAAGCVEFAGAEKFVGVCDVETGAQLWSFERPDRRSCALLFSSDPARLYFCEGSQVHVWSSETGRPLFDIECPDASLIFGLALSRDGNRLATYDRKTTHLWNAHTGSLRRTIRDVLGNSDIYDAAFSPDARRLVVSGRHCACFVDTTTGTVLGSLRTAAAGTAFRRCHFMTSLFRPSASSSLDGRSVDET